MNPEGLSSLYTYNDYANKLTLQEVEKLSTEQLIADSSPSRGNVHSLLVHMLAVEIYFLDCCMGRPFEFAPQELTKLDQIRQRWEDLAAQRETYLAAVSGSELAETIQVQIRDREFILPRWQLLTQAVVHSIHHRGELSIVLSQLGHPLPTLDPILHFVRQSGQDWPWE